MTPILRVTGLWLDAPGGRQLFRDLELSLGRERVALVGRNGVGKSSLLEVLAGRETPEQGRVVENGLRRLVPQVLPDCEPGLSPGERRKRALEEAFEDEPDLLLLDEPTRDLDAASVAWLASRLARWDDALVVVTHDRRILREFRQFFVIAETGCRAFEGSFDELLAELRRADAESTRRYAQNLGMLLDKEQHNATVRRRRQRKKNVGRIRELGRCPSRIRLNGKRSYKQVSQATRSLLQEERIAGMRAWVRSTRRALSVVLPLPAVLPELPHDSGEPIICLEHVSARVRGRALFERLNLELGRERVAITGPNGSGKTTLVSVMMKERRPDSGRAFANLERIGFIAQNATNFRLEEPLLELLSTSPERAAELLAAHQFPFALAERPLRSLSPGERVRAALICILQRRPTVELLVLDEPTDDLDLLATVALESLLRSWNGGLVVASHDVEFLNGLGITRRIELA
jgi:ATPase subunit of ABC transporter with duplicated ATPase domains